MNAARETPSRVDLIILDELGFAPLDDTGTQLLFRLVAGAYRASHGDRDGEQAGAPPKFSNPGDVLVLV